MTDTTEAPVFARMLSVTTVPPTAGEVASSVSRWTAPSGTVSVIVFASPWRRSSAVRASWNRAVARRPARTKNPQPKTVIAAIVPSEMRKAVPPSGALATPSIIHSKKKSASTARSTAKAVI